MKRCTKCHKDQTLSDYYKGKRYKNGFRSQCKKCCAKQSNDWSKNFIRTKKIRNRCRQCGDKLGLHKSIYCSTKCMNKLLWLKQKSQKGYKEYHREIARKWAKENYIHR